MDTWVVIAEERASILETFEGLSPEQWDVPSLCGHWTVRQVLGHLVIAADPPTGRFAVELAKAGGSFDRATGPSGAFGTGAPAAARADPWTGRTDNSHMRYAARTGGTP